MRYHGWTNKHSWLVFTWLTSGDDGGAYWYSLAGELTLDSRDVAMTRLAELVKQYLADNTPLTTGLYADLLNIALNEVNYREVAIAFME